MMFMKEVKMIRLEENIKTRNILLFFKLFIFLILFIIFIFIKFEIVFTIHPSKVNKNDIFNNNYDKNETKFNSNEKNSKYISIDAIYKTTKKNEKIELFNKIYIQFIQELIIEENKIIPSYDYSFPDPGEYHIIFNLSVENLTSAEFMFHNIDNLIILMFQYKFLNINLKSSKGMFKSCHNLREIKFNNYFFQKVEDFSYMFQDCKSLKFLDFSNIITNETRDIKYMFANCTSINLIDLSGSDTTNTKDISGLFYNCSSLISIDLSAFKTLNIITMRYTFAYCTKISNINLNTWQFKNLKDMSYLFKNCYRLTSVVLPELEDQNEINKEGIFSGCQSLNKEKYDFCIIGYWFGTNYGSLATYFALHQAVKNMGYSILMIDSPLVLKREENYDKCHPITIGRVLYNISQTKSLNRLYEFNNICKGFLLGSDQLWKPLLSRPFKQFFFLDFVDDSLKKIAYGTSFGDPYYGTLEEKIITKKNLNRFTAISVRDKLSVNITKNIFGIENVVQVCDPSFICNISEYITLANKSTNIQNGSYILAYVLDPTEEKGYRLERLSIDKNITVVIILDERQETWERNKGRLHLRGKGKIIVKEKVDLNDFMWYFNHSNAVFTDSFHGTIFSIIFKKPFITLRNVARGGERFYSLLDPINLRERLFETPSCINDRYDLYDKINYEIPYKKLNEIKEFSYNWLKTALKE